MLISGDLSAINGKYIFLDNDFLGALFEDEDFSENILKYFSKSHLTIDPLTEFEFLRDVWLPERRNVKEDFVSNEIFFPQSTQHQLMEKVQNNALILSKIYSYEQSKRKGGGKAGWSTIDLFLAGRVMNYYSSSVLITGNKKDFSTSVFDLIGVINKEELDGGIRCFSILIFNMEKFNKCSNSLMSF